LYEKVIIRWNILEAERLRFPIMEMGGQVGGAPACHDSSVDSNADISQKYKIGDISYGVAHTL
jgi:hypothetical protein